MQVTRDVLRRLEPELLVNESSRLENSINHLKRSIDELESFVSGGDDDDEDGELSRAIAENKETIASQEARLEMIRDVLSEKLGRDQVDRHYALANANGTTQAQTPEPVQVQQGQSNATTGEEGVYL